jgi:hypothetical protein
MRAPWKSNLKNSIRNGFGKAREDVRAHKADTVSVRHACTFYERAPGWRRPRMHGTEVMGATQPLH